MTQKDDVLSSKNISWLFWGCFIALVTTSFGFIIRAQIIGDWGTLYNFSETQKGELAGVGLWPFSLSIVLFSLIIDRIGYGRAMIFAFACHIISPIITILAPALAASGDGEINKQTVYWMLYVGNFILALGNGTVEAVINPAIASIYSKEKTKWLNILHAGWPGGLVLGGILALLMGEKADWRFKVGLILIPAIVYGFVLIKSKFPIHERVKAGISFKTMLQEAGIIGALIVIIIMVGEIGRIFSWSLTLQIIIFAILIISYGVYVRSTGKPLFIFLVLIMIPLAITELGTDSWITELVKPIMQGIGLQAGWVLVYTSLIMMILRFFAGPIIHRLSPLGLLATCSTIAIIGLITLSIQEAALGIFLAATIYGIGKTFFWPTMLGVVAERFPKGGALTLNTISGVGMLAVGVVGTAFFGNIVDKPIENTLKGEKYQVIYNKVIGEEKASIFGQYRPVDKEKVVNLNNDEKKELEQITITAQKNALFKVAIFPTIMLICYLILIGYFRAKGGYKAVEL